MPLEYGLEQKIKNIAPALKEYSAWFAAVHSDTPATVPGLLLGWLGGEGAAELLKPEQIEEFRQNHHKLIAAGKPNPGQFEDFIAELASLEKKIVSENLGYDSLTSLRSKRVLVNDLKKELDRLARNGQQFTVAIARIDGFQKIRDSFGEDKARDYVVLVSGLIKKSLRAFDDAYVFADDKFILCMKQSEARGGIAALERLRHELERENITINFGNEKVPLTVSCCVAEPLPDEKVHELLENLDADLNNPRNESDMVLKHYEMSPLERYVQAAKE
ncbi:MAG TPA: hypothetical protein DEA55_06430 [Rhodospirillaceae bacterium]|nr:hypothetical protein [Rhodospirillaceae bacterium]